MPASNRKLLICVLISTVPPAGWPSVMTTVLPMMLPACTPVAGERVVN